MKIMSEGEVNSLLFDEVASARAENERLRAALHAIGAMVAMDRHGNIRFKPDYSPEDMLNAVNASLET